jgi:HSP20 family protein
MTLVRFEPFREIESIHNAMQRYFDDFPALFRSSNVDSFSPRIDITDKEGNIHVEAEIPGVNKKDLKITLQDNILTIEGEKKKEEEKEEKNYYRTERVYGSFKRSFTLPVEVNPDNVKAKFDNGILAIELERIEPKQPEKKIIDLK